MEEIATEVLRSQFSSEMFCFESIIEMIGQADTEAEKREARERKRKHSQNVETLVNRVVEQITFRCLPKTVTEDLKQSFPRIINDEAAYIDVLLTDDNVINVRVSWLIPVAVDAKQIRDQLQRLFEHDMWEVDVFSFHSFDESS